MHVLAGLTIAVALFVGQAKSPVTTKPDPAFPLKPGYFIWYPEIAMFPGAGCRDIWKYSRSSRGSCLLECALQYSAHSTASTGRPGHAIPTALLHHPCRKTSTITRSRKTMRRCRDMGRLTWHGHLVLCRSSAGSSRVARMRAGSRSSSRTSRPASPPRARRIRIAVNSLLQGKNAASGTGAGVREPRQERDRGRVARACLMIPLARALESQRRTAQHPDEPAAIPTVYVNSNGVLIGRSAMTVQNPERPLAAGVFVMLEGESTIPNTFVPGRPMPRWMVVSLPTENNELLKHGSYLDAASAPTGIRLREGLRHAQHPAPR